MPAPTWLTARMLLGRFRTPTRDAALAAAVGRVPLSVIRERLRAVRDVDVCSELEHVEVPVLDMRGRHDTLVPRNAGQFIVDHTRRLQTAELDAPHLILQAAPRAAAEVLLEHVAEWRTSGAAT